MNKQMRNTLLMIASAGSAVGGLILILTQIVSETKDYSIIYIAVTATLLSCLFNMIRSQGDHEDDIENSKGVKDYGTQGNKNNRIQGR